MRRPPALPLATTRRLLPWGAVLAVGLASTACSHLDVPHAHNYPASSQAKARSAHHWDVLATDVAMRITQGLGEGVPVAAPSAKPPMPSGSASDGVATVVIDTTAPAATPSGTPRSLNQLRWRLAPQRPSTFNRAFAALLTHRLVQQGVVLVNDQADGSIDYEVQVIEHGSRVGNVSPMASTELAAGVLVLRDWLRYSQGSTSTVLSALTLGLAADTSRLLLDGTASGGPTRTEVLVTTTVRLAGRLHHTTSDIYYIDPADLPLYIPPVDPPPPPPPVPVKTWRMVGE